MDWKNKFLKLYMSTNEDDVQQAINLKEENIPRHLYRYRSASETKFVQSELLGQIYMPHIRDLNDPFDSCSLLTSENINRYFDMEVFRAKLEHITGSKIPDEKLKDDTWSEDMMDYVMSLQGIPDTNKKTAIELYQVDARKNLEESNARLNEIVKSDYRIACFSETPYNLPMWNHYANGHRGICLEYDTLKFNYNPTLRQRLFPVYYQDRLPDILELMKDMDLKHLPKSLFDYILIHKLRDWSYEKEWRLVLNLLQIEEADNKGDTGTIKWLTKPSKVYIGTKTGEDMKYFIIWLCEKLKIDIYQMECTEYGLRESLVGKCSDMC